MPDITLKTSDTTGEYDISVANADLVTGNDLANAVLISLFTWARAGDDDELPPNSPKNGFWGDLISDYQNHITGSRLWLLRREKLTQENINKAVDFIKEALQWMLDDSIISNIEVMPERVGIDELNVKVILHKPDGLTENIRFQKLWQAIAGGEYGK